MQKTSGQCHINKTLWLFLLSLLFFPENYQPATSRSPRESWTADGSTNAKTAKHLAVLSLFLAVSVRKDKNREGDTTAANRFSASSDEIRIILMNITTVGYLSIYQRPIPHDRDHRCRSPLRPRSELSV
jgi:hypothetical protein